MRALAVGALAIAAMVGGVVGTCILGARVAVPRVQQTRWNGRGVWLGMSPAEVVRSFADASDGAWSRAVGCSGVALEWERMDPRAPTRWARFEFHDGQLVAVRMRVDDASPRPAVVKTSEIVMQRRPYQGGSAITVLARTCRSHSAEAEQIAMSARPSD